MGKDGDFYRRGIFSRLSAEDSEMEGDFSLLLVREHAGVEPRLKATDAGRVIAE